MEVVSSLYMNSSDHGEYSYANNSVLQGAAILKARPMLEQTIKTMHLDQDCFAIADLGCSSGPNTFLSLSHVIHAILQLCQKTGQSPPELQVFLNDLPTNDFNSVFLSLPDFYKRLQKDKGCALVPCYISGTPGSFHGRLFPASSLHLVHSSYSLHWLSQVPQGIDNNRGNIYIGRTSPKNVCKTYLKQFQTDFSNFLSHRAKELKPRGRMILTLIGKSEGSTILWELLSKSLMDMAAVRVIEEGDVDLFNSPHYFASEGEVKEIVEREGSFNIDQINTFETNWDGIDDDEENGSYEFDEQERGQNVANIMRAVLESMIASHFGENVIDDFFVRFAEYVGHHLSTKKPKYLNIVISMTKN